MSKVIKSIVVHSGGMDSSICLALAVKEFGADHILSLSFSYGQRHSSELKAAKKIADYLKVKNQVIDITCLKKITSNSLLDHGREIKSEDGIPNTLVVGRNGLMARVSAIHANSLGANSIFMGIIEVEEANSGYRDCSRNYMDIIESALRLDFDNPSFQIKTPLVKMTKKETMVLANELGYLDYFLEETITCYQGMKGRGCKVCPACKLRNEGVDLFFNS